MPPKPAKTAIFTLNIMLYKTTKKEAMATSLLKNGAKTEIILRITRNMLPAEHPSSRKQIQVSMPKILQAIGQQRQAAKKSSATTRYKIRSSSRTTLAQEEITPHEA